MARMIVALSLVLLTSPAWAVKLYAAKTVSGDFDVGGSVVYTIVISHETLDSQPDNPGDEFRDDLPAGLTLVSAAASSGTAVANVAVRQVSWNGAIPPNQTVTITIYAVVTALTGDVSNQGYVAFADQGQGVNNVIRYTDDPNTEALDDPTTFTVGQVVVEEPIVELPLEEPIVELPLEEPIVELLEELIGPESADEATPTEEAPVEEPGTDAAAETEADAGAEAEAGAEKQGRASDDGCSGTGAGEIVGLLILALSRRRWVR